MRRMIIVAVLCLISPPAFACVFDTDCKPGILCVEGECNSIKTGDEDESTPRDRVNGAKYCQYDGDCSEGSRCIKGSSGREGVCLGHCKGVSLDPELADELPPILLRRQPAAHRGETLPR